MPKLYRRLTACAALLVWLMAAGTGVHAHFGYGGADSHDASSHHANSHHARSHHEGHSDSDHAAPFDEHSRHHGPALSVHSVLDASHEQQHAEGEQIDTGLEQLQSVVGKSGSKFDLLLLTVVQGHLSAPFASVPTDFPAASPPLRPPRHSSAAPPPLRAPPVLPA